MSASILPATTILPTANSLPAINSLPTANSLPLEDIITPDSVSLWPPAPGWWLLLIIICCAIVAAWVYIKRHQQHWGYRKEALTLLQHHYSQWQAQQNASETCLAMLTVLKRTALTAFPETKTLYGQTWVNFLNSHTGKPAISEKTAVILTTLQYQHDTDLDIQRLYADCCQWIKQHKAMESH